MYQYSKENMAAESSQAGTKQSKKSGAAKAQLAPTSNQEPWKIAMRVKNNCEGMFKNLHMDTQA